MMIIQGTLARPLSIAATTGGFPSDLGSLLFECCFFLRIKLSSVLRYTGHLQTLKSEHRALASPAVSQGLCMCLSLCPNAFSHFVHLQSLGSRHLLYEALLAFSSPPNCMYVSFIFVTRETSTNPMCTERADQGPVRGLHSRHRRKAVPLACWGQMWD